MGWFHPRIVVDLREEETGKALRAEVSALREQILTLETRCNSAEYRLMFEFHVNEQLVDLCRESGVDVPRRLFQRPESEKSNGL